MKNVILLAIFVFFLIGTPAMVGAAGFSEIFGPNHGLSKAEKEFVINDIEKAFIKLSNPSAMKKNGFWFKMKKVNVKLKVLDEYSAGNYAGNATVHLVSGFMDCLIVIRRDNKPDEEKMASFFFVMTTRTMLSDDASTGEKAGQVKFEKVSGGTSFYDEPGSFEKVVRRCENAFQKAKEVMM